MEGRTQLNLTSPGGAGTAAPGGYLLMALRPKRRSPHRWAGGCRCRARPRRNPAPADRLPEPARPQSRASRHAITTAAATELDDEYVSTEHVMVGWPPVT